MITEEMVLKALSQVQEPDLGSDLVTLKMIKNLTIKDTRIEFTIVLTTPACPMKDMMKKACEQAIRLLVSESATVDINFESNVLSHRKDVQQLLPQIKNIIAVVSGKGGVGKSTVAANLALSLALSGSSVGLMDADIYGPSVPIMFGIRGERPKMRTIDGKGFIVPIEKHNIKLMSIGLLIDEKDAVVWRGPMVSSAVKQFISEVDWGALDYLIIDMPPGTGDIHLTLMQTLPFTGAVVVTTPQPVALIDAKKAIAMFAQLPNKIPVLGIVENMAYFTPAELPNNKYYIFGKQGGYNLSVEYDMPFLGEIPIVQTIREAGDEGKPIILSETDPISKNAFLNFSGLTVRSIAKLAGM
ncbi:MAG: Mrp/NBP35 family ATP-binding protein [Phycisphaerales bacterium]|nr:Mrp/NBP35 family ATP-binding protein [Phycisphaerales bacterium]